MVDATKLGRDDTRSLALRLWLYQRERFPVFAHGLLIATLSLSALAVSALLAGREAWPSLPGAGVAFATLFLVFFQLRVADEFKDHADDTRYRAYRPVPRGLVSLAELGALGGAAAAVQLALALWLDGRLVWLLLAVWLYVALMSVEFFVGPWLKARPVAYAATHTLILPLIMLYATACDWLVAGDRVPPGGLAAFLAMGFCNGVVFEIARKIRAPHDEEPGVETYSALWGRPRATAVWSAALACSAVAAVALALYIDFLLPVALVCSALLAIALVLGSRFLEAPTTRRAKAIERVSSVWIVCLLVAVGILPLVVRA